MSGLSSLLSYLRDPKLAPHATGALPAWLWSVDATHLLWANPPAAAIFDVSSPAALAGHLIDPKGSAALQIARIAATLPQGAAPRLERLRGFGAGMGRALMCSCTRVMLDDRTPAILIVATEPAGPSLPLAERVRRLCVGIEEPAAFFSIDGALLHATPAAEQRLAGVKSIAALGAQPVSIDRIGADASAVLLATFSQAAAQAVSSVAAATTQAVVPQETKPQEAKPEPPAAPAPPMPAVPPAPVAPPRAAPERRQPLRFVWQMDADARLTFDSEEFTAVIGSQATAALRRPWREVARELDLDPDGQIERALASRETWSGITVAFPVDGTDQRLPVELSGLPVFGRERTFLGYRGFGVCRDAARLAELAHARRDASPATQPEIPKADVAPKPAPQAEPAEPKPEPRPEPPVFREERPALTVVPPVENVLPFRPSAPPDKPSLTPVERRAFRELASKLTARLREAQSGALNGATTLDVPEESELAAAPVEPAAPAIPAPAPVNAEPTITNDQRPILDRLPLGVLVYRLDRLLYANRAFLDWTGYGSIHALADAGGLDALFIEPGADTLSQNGAKSLAITTSRGSQMPIEARLFSTPWDGESALVLMFTGTGESTKRPGADKTSDADAAEAKELRSILDTATDGIVVLDREGRVISINRSAETLFGHQSRELAGRPMAGLFTPESQRTAFDAVDQANREGAAGALGKGREVFARGREGAAIPLLMAAGQVSGDRLVAVFRSLAPWKNVEEEDLLSAKRQAEQASSKKSDFLAKVSHEIRTPLNAIIGFSEVMLEERFGPVGNDRYKQYLKDIHASGEHLISLLNDLLDLSKIEAGKLDLTFAPLDLNELVQQCVALMQPQANRERIIIRTALSSSLPPVLADARSVRQIALNLLSNSIKFTAAGGQVIVSTALNDAGEVVLRVRDTGVGMSEKDIAVALEPFRQLATSARFGSDGTGLGLPLTKALVEANRATFNIKSAVNAGTLIEVAFPGRPLAAE